MIVLLAVVFFKEKTRITKLKRPDYGADSKSYEVVVEKDGKNSEVVINVEAKELPEEEMQKYFDESFDVLCKSILGNNRAFNEIESDLVLKEDIGEYGIKAQYFIENTSLINYFGEINNKGITEKTNTSIKVELTYLDYSQSYEIPIVILPKEQSESEKLESLIGEKIKDQNKDSDYVELPEVLENEKISFYEKGTGVGPVIALVLITAVVLIYYSKFYKPKTEKEKRQKELVEDYSEIVSKLSLLMGAGMSTYNALSKICSDYYSANNTSRYAYEELRRCINQISSGTMETVAYKEFGRRCGVHSYIKLSGLLIQNIRKGSEDILVELKYEVDEAFEERKCKARKAGEIISTKLLFPMMLQLMVVLIIIMIPAFR